MKLTASLCSFLLIAATLGNAQQLVQITFTTLTGNESWGFDPDDGEGFTGVLAFQVIQFTA